MQVLMMNAKKILTREPSRQVEDINCLHSTGIRCKWIFFDKPRQMNAECNLKSKTRAKLDPVYGSWG